MEVDFMKKLISIILAVTLCLVCALPALAADSDFYLKNAESNGNGSYTNTTNDGRIVYTKEELNDAWIFSATVTAPISGNGSSIDVTVMLSPDSTAGVSTQVQFKTYCRDTSTSRTAMNQIWYQGAKANVGSWTNYNGEHTVGGAEGNKKAMKSNAFIIVAEKKADDNKLYITLKNTDNTVIDTVTTGEFPVSVFANAKHVGIQLQNGTATVSNLSFENATVVYDPVSLDDFYTKNAILNSDNSFTNTANDGRIIYKKEALARAWVFSAQINAPISGDGSSIDAIFVLTGADEAGITTQVMFKTYCRDTNSNKTAMNQIYYQGAKAYTSDTWTNYNGEHLVGGSNESNKKAMKSTQFILVAERKEGDNKLYITLKNLDGTVVDTVTTGEIPASVFANAKYAGIQLNNGTASTCNISLVNTVHDHTFATEWSYDNDNHWYAATCGHATEVSDKAPHNYVSGVCACGKPEPVHDHTFATAWTYDDDNHWHAATCEHTTETTGTAPHDYVEGVCVCGKPEPVHEHTFATAWKYDDNYHWHVATCEHEEISGKAAHSFVKGVCVCGMAEPGDLYYVINVKENADGSFTNTASDGRVIYIRRELEDAWTITSEFVLPISGAGSSVDLVFALTGKDEKGITTQIQFKTYCRDDSAGKSVCYQIWYQGAKAYANDSWTNYNGTHTVGGAEENKKVIGSTKLTIVAEKKANDNRIYITLKSADGKVVETLTTGELPASVFENAKYAGVQIFNGTATVTKVAMKGDEIDPSTGDHTPLALVFAVMVLSAAAMVVVSKKRTV